MKRTLVYASICVVLGLGFLAVASRNTWWQRLANAPFGSPKPRLVFAVIGDTEGYAEIYAQALKNAHDLGATFILHTGDVTSDGSTENFITMSGVAQSAQIEVMAAVGNHDIRDDKTRALFRQYVNPPNLAFDRGQFRFLILDNADRKIGFSDATLDFLKKDLSEHPKATYVITFHRPFGLPLSGITGDDETAVSRPTNEVFLQAIKDVKVTAIFTGHLHVYLPYTLQGVRTFVTGGGGGDAQTALGPLGVQGHHFLLVREESNGQLRIEMQKLP
jgi:predicted phosphodiesterase